MASGCSKSASQVYNNAATKRRWTLVRRTNNTSTTSNALAVYRRSAIAGEPASYTWGVAGGAFAVGGIQSFSGVDAANPIDVENGQSTASATAHDTPSITTTVANTMLVTAHTYASSNTWTPQAGLTEGFDRPSGTNSNTGQSVTAGHQLKAATGASGTKRSTAGGGADVGNTHILALRPFVPNAPPTVSLTSPANGSTFTAPASITLTATAADPDGTIQKVEFFHGGTNLIATVTTAPYTFPWTAVPQGSYVLTAVATDNQTATTTSAPVNVTVQAAVALYFVEVDHLNTPRLVANDQQQAVWRWDLQEPFGVNPPDENPSSLGMFEFPLRFPGQYADKETNLYYNYFRDYDAVVARYVQSDLIGLRGGLNTFLYANGNPLSYIDPKGEAGLAGTLVIGAIALGVGIAISMSSSSNKGGGSSSKSEECPPNERDEYCEKVRQREEALCVAIAGPRYPGNPQQAIAICMKAAFQRYIKCRQGLPEHEWPPLTGVDTPI